MNFNKIFENWNRNVLLQEDKLTDEIQQLKKIVEEEISTTSNGKNLLNIFNNPDPKQNKELRKVAISSALQDLNSNLENNKNYNLKVLGEGSFRTVYALSDGSEAVLKVAKSKDALKQNIEEANLGRKPESRASELYTKSYEVDPNGIWIVSEFITPVGKFDFEDEVAPNFINFLKTKGLYDYTNEMENYKMSLLYVSNFIKNKKVIASGISNYEHLRFFEFYINILNKNIWNCQLDPYSEERPEVQVIRSLLAGNVCPSFEQFVVDATKAAKKDKLLINLLINAMEYSGVSVWDIRPKNVGLDSDDQAKVLDASIDLGDFTDIPNQAFEAELVSMSQNYKPDVIRKKEEWEKKKNDELLAQIRADNLARMEKEKQKLKQDPALVGATVKPGAINKPSSDTKTKKDPQFADTEKNDQEDPDKTKKAGIAESISWENDFSGAMIKFIRKNND